jgi:hypothetical protein
MAAGSSFPQEPDLIAHERTYKAFNVLVRWCMVLLGDAILVLTLGFASPMTWLGAVVAGVVVFVAAYVFVIRHEARQPLDVWTLGR